MRLALARKQACRCCTCQLATFLDTRLNGYPSQPMVAEIFDADACLMALCVQLRMLLIPDLQTLTAMSTDEQTSWDSHLKATPGGVLRLTIHATVVCQDSAGTKVI